MSQLTLNDGLEKQLFCKFELLFLSEYYTCQLGFRLHTVVSLKIKYITICYELTLNFLHTKNIVYTIHSFLFLTRPV